MAITHRDTQKSATGTTSTIVTKPTGCVDGDLLFAAATSISSAIGAPAGWTSIRNTPIGASTWYLRTFYKVASGEGASFTFTGATFIRAIVSCFAGAATAAPLDVESGQSNTPSVNRTAPGVTTTAANDLLIHASGSATSGGAIAPPTGMTEPTNGEETGSAMEVAYLLDAGAAGATGNKVATSATAVQNAAHLAAFFLTATPVNATGTAAVGTAAAAGLAATGSIGHTATATVGAAAGSGLSATATSGALGTAAVGTAAAAGLAATGSISYTATATVGSAAGAGLTATGSAGVTGIATVGSAAGAGLAATATAVTTGLASVGTATGAGLLATAGISAAATASVGTATGDGLAASAYALIPIVAADAAWGAEQALTAAWAATTAPTAEWAPPAALLGVWAPNGELAAAWHARELVTATWTEGN